MNYQEFNCQILRYYASRSTSSFCSLSMNLGELERIVTLGDIKQFFELKSDWSPLLDEVNGVPQYFGLISVQCFAASQMHSDENNAADAYQIRLKEAIGLEPNFDLQQLFRGSDPNFAVQEQIWHNAKLYFQKEYGLHIDIPVRTSYKGRFIQYPKSQVLLTLEDLKYFTRFFSQEFEVNCDASLNYFRQRLLSSLRNITQTERAQRLFQDESKREKCIRQIYDYFAGWNGEVFHGRTIQTASVGRLTESSTRSGRLLLIFEDKCPRFFVMDQQQEIIDEVRNENIFSVSDITYSAPGLIFLNELEYYQYEFASSRFLHQESVVYIAVERQVRPSEYDFLEKNSLESTPLSPSIDLFKCQFNTNFKYSILSQYIQAKNPVSLIGGIRLNRRREYIIGFGPLINCASDHVILQEGIPHTYDPHTSVEGLYKVRVDNFKDVEFRIVQTKELSKAIEKGDKGWNLNSFKIDTNFHLEGCYMLNGRGDADIRVWIDLLTKRSKMRYQGSNILLKAINQAAK